MSSDKMAARIIKKVSLIEPIQSAGDPTTPLLVRDVLSTGLPNLDRILSVSVDGKWGLPVGKIINIKAKPAVGKTSFILKVAREVQKRKGIVWIIESEHTLDLNYIRALNVDPDRPDFLVSQPDTLEKALESAEVGVEECAKVRSENDNSPFLLIMDTFSGFTPEEELKGGSMALGEHARQASRFCRKITGPLDRARAILLVVHQVKSKIGVTWGNPDTEIGGAAFNFHGSINLDLRKLSSIKEGTRIIGHYGIIKTTKNKLYPPFREVRTRLINGRGFDRSFSILDFLLIQGVVVKKAGGRFHFKSDRDLKFHGQDGFADFMKRSKKGRKLVKRALKK